MRMDIKYYRAWVSWAITRSASIPHEHLVEFVASVTLPFRILMEQFADFPTNGKAWILVPQLLAWVKANPDPLGRVRDAMESSRKKWTKPDA